MFQATDFLLRALGLIGVFCLFLTSFNQRIFAIKNGSKQTGKLAEQFIVSCFWLFSQCCLNFCNRQMQAAVSVVGFISHSVSCVTFESFIIEEVVSLRVSLLQQCTSAGLRLIWRLHSSNKNQQFLHAWSLQNVKGHC